MKLEEKKQFVDDHIIGDELWFLNHLSIIELKHLARKAKSRYDYLNERRPSYDQAIAAGVEDLSYVAGHNSGSQHSIPSYNGTATVTLRDGSVWECTGYEYQGLHEYGHIDFKRVEGPWK
jgi:hypothetical protein